MSDADSARDTRKGPYFIKLSSDVWRLLERFVKIHRYPYMVDFSSSSSSPRAYDSISDFNFAGT